MMGAKYGESKWRKKFITIEKGYLTCYTEDGDVSQFKFPLEGREMMLAGQKEAKRKGSMKIMKDGEVLIYIEVTFFLINNNTIGFLGQIRQMSSQFNVHAFKLKLFCLSCFY